MTLKRAVSLSALSLVFASAASAQALAFLYGHIVDPSAAAVAGTSVTVVNEENGFRHFTTTESDGAYSVGPLTPGLYKLTVRKDGFRTMIRFHVAVDGARPARADFALSLGSVQETITVEDTSDPTGLGRRNDPAVTTQLYREDLDNLPLDGRGLLGLVEFAPGTNVVPATRGDPGQFVADGQRPNTNSFFVDGISANLGVTAGGLPAQAAGGSLPILSAFGSLDSLIPVSAVQDFEIRTSSATSPFGRLPGAAVSITSRSGSNEFHGSAGYTFRNELLAANDWFANRAGAPRTELRENSVDTSLSGPIWRNQTFFFLGYEWMNLAQPFMWVEPVPSVTARAAAPSWAQPVLALYPLPNGPALGQGLAGWNGRDWRPSGLHAGSARLDHAFTPHLAA
ncbi:MAG: carboxypeptidase regulatory-like domain-containing protein, partial [Acidobacteriia bacterium]|nr:carboxypeptidase regulatory-like domain-containing protein [Terriglobia bacterium]